MSRPLRPPYLDNPGQITALTRFILALDPFQTVAIETALTHLDIPTGRTDAATPPSPSTVTDSFHCVIVTG